MNEDQPVTDAYSLPLDAGNKLSLVFRKLPLTERDHERIVAFVHLVMEALVTPLTGEIVTPEPPMRKMRARVTTDEQAAKIEQNIKAQEGEVLRRRAREQAYSAASVRISPTPSMETGNERGENSGETSQTT